MKTIETRKTEFIIILFAWVGFLTLSFFLPFFRNNLILIMIVASIVFLEIKERLIYLAVIILLLVLPLFLFFFPDEKISQYLGDLIYFLFLIAAIKQIFLVWFKNEQTH